MAVMNMMEPIVQEVMDKYWKELHMSCSCNTCKTDLLALTLNRIPPKYASKERGIVIIKALYVDEQLRADIFRQLLRSAAEVSSRPLHENANLD